MINYKLGQLVVKIKHPDWETPYEENHPYAIPIGAMGEVIAVTDYGVLSSTGKIVKGVGVSFPAYGLRICQIGTIIPMEEEQGDANTVTTWDKCAWRPKEDFVDSFDLDFTKQKTV